MVPLMLDDIRDTDADEYWETLRERWGALLSYRYIGRRFSSMNTGEVDDTVTIRSDMRDATGGIRASVFAICAPGGGSPSDLEVVPNPVINSVQVVDPGVDVERVEVLGPGALKVGSRMYFGRARIVDAADHDRTLALVEGQGVSIGAVPEGMDRFDDEAVMHVEDSPDLPPLWQVLGGERRADGHWGCVALRAELASPDAALHVGPQFVVHEAAALDLAAAVAGTDALRVESAHTMFLARGKAGPFRVDGEATRGSGRTIGVELTMHDEGAGDRAVSAATFTIRPA